MGSRGSVSLVSFPCFCEDPGVVRTRIRILSGLTIRSTSWDLWRILVDVDFQQLHPVFVLKIGYVRLFCFTN